MVFRIPFIGTISVLPELGVAAALSTSSFVILPRGPVPETLVRSTLSSLANRLAAGTTATFRCGSPEGLCSAVVGFGFSRCYRYRIPPTRPPLQ